MVDELVRMAGGMGGGLESAVCPAKIAKTAAAACDDLGSPCKEDGELRVKNGREYRGLGSFNNGRKLPSERAQSSQTKDQRGFMK